ncbi:hypothetical protein NPX13_g1302 [Xylaria arbuscula]|uniref:Glycoside hydrolase 131 catalytic N-terminal domain-containing protein n=1 Tax=Xylaria arbuscula TaxID=114810 RepID=A0A9W8NMB8_9PEZI|nr:hypothetical protein NPX13_g1302 [Xylaria arbuscula]
MKASLISVALAHLARAAVIWDGRFNDFTSSADLNKWSWANQVGPYQYYIHGSSSVEKYVNLSPDYKNPADTVSKQGAKFTLDGTAFWNGQNMRRTEYTHPADQGSHQQRQGILPLLDDAQRHQRAERKPGAPDLLLRVALCRDEVGLDLGRVGHFEPEPPVYGLAELQVEDGVESQRVDFSRNTVGFWESEGANPLKQVVAPVSASTSSNGADWHLGVLELPRSGYSDTTEDFYFSGVYVESGTITTAVSGPTA